MPEGPGIWKGTNPVGVADRCWKPLIVPSADALRAPPRQTPIRRKLRRRLTRGLG
jgi:hypothetical protein